VTLTELAEAAGTSRAAASYALNDQPGVSDSTRHHVLETAKRIGYKRRSPRRPVIQTRSFGVALSPTRHHGETPNYFVAELLAGANQEAQRRDVGLDVQIWTPNWEPDHRGRVDGVLFLGGAIDPDFIAATELPAVIVGTSFSELTVDSVLADNRQGIYLSTAHLLDQGCRRVALLNGPDHATTTSSKLTGYADALIQRDLRLDFADVRTVEFDAAAGEAAARELLSGPDRPDGIVAGDDVIAIGALHAALDLGLRVPEDLRIVGFGNSPTAELMRPALSSVDVFLQQMGHLAVRRLLDRLDAAGSDVPFVRSLVGPRLAVRDSSGAAS
jgi:DNA-binding LacI/PurR family transcriptional regulator